VHLPRPSDAREFAGYLLMLLAVGVFLEAGFMKAVVRGNTYDFSGMYRGGRAIATGVNPYSDEAIAHVAPDAPKEPGVRFVYPPASALFFVPLALLPYEVANRLWMLLGLICLAYLARALARHWLGDLQGSDRLVWAGIGLLLLASYHSISHALQVGQATLVVAALIMGGFELAQSRLELKAAALLAIGSFVKPVVVLLPVYLLLKRRWRIVGIWAGLMVVGLVLSLAVFGLQLHADYLRYFVAHHGQPMYWVSFQDAVAFWGRLLVWEHAPLRQFAHLAGPLTLATQIILALPVLLLLPWRRWDELSDRRRLAELSLLVLVAIVASNLAAIHIYLLLIPGLAAALAYVRDDGRGAGVVWWLTAAWAVSYCLLALPFDYRAPELQRGILVLAISTKFYGAIILWGILTYLLARSKPAGEGEGGRSGVEL